MIDYLDFLQHLHANKPLHFWVISVSVYAAVIVVDFFTGLIASIFYRKEAFRSSRMSPTIGKGIMAFLFALIGVFYMIAVNFNFILVSFLYLFLFIAVVKEMRSISENFENIFGYETYLGKLLGNLLSILEFKFFKRILDNDKSTNLTKDESNDTEP